MESLPFADLLAAIGRWAPPELAESYDNTGLLVAPASASCTGALLSLELTEAVLDEALQQGCNLIISHHPIWFGPKTRLDGRDWVSRLLLRAIREGIGLYALHTNLDNLRNGVNQTLAGKLGLVDTHILAPKAGLWQRLSISADAADWPVIAESIEALRAELAPEAPQSQRTDAAGRHELSLQLPAFRCGEFRQQLSRLPAASLLVSQQPEAAGPPAYGAGLLGHLPEPLPKQAFLRRLQDAFGSECIRYADASLDGVQRVAICGGAGSFLIPAALSARADALVTGDITHHKFFDGEGRCLLCDIGHWESEQFTPELLAAFLRNNFPSFAFHLSTVNTNPVTYFSATDG